MTWVVLTSKNIKIFVIYVKLVLEVRPFTVINAIDAFSTLIIIADG
jgi:hypothetical protein